jgi:ABC-type multidrug transport system ATPase subunit
MTHELQFSNVQMKYGRRVAVSLRELRVPGGQAVGLVGPNGAGKTSIARLATGFRVPNAGSVTVSGMPARDYRRKHGIGYVPEELPRVGRCTVRQLLQLRLAGPDGLSNGAARKVIETLRVRDLLERRVTELSKGQWRAALLAYATLSASGLIVLDEPEAGLDPIALDRLAELVALVRSAGSIVVSLSHQLFEVERTCDRVLFIRDGSIVAEEPAVNGGAFLRERYKEVFA